MEDLRKFGDKSVLDAPVHKLFNVHIRLLYNEYMARCGGNRYGKSVNHISGISLHIIQNLPENLLKFRKRLYKL